MGLGGFPAHAQRFLEENDALPFFHDAAFPLEKLLGEVGAEALHACVGGLHVLHRGGDVSGGRALNEKTENQEGAEQDAQRSAHNDIP